MIPVSALASDAEPLTIVALEGAPEWVTVVDESRSILVDPAGRIGRVDFVAVISDPGGLQVRVPVTIELVNLAPVANPDVVRADSGPVTFAAARQRHRSRRRHDRPAVGARHVDVPNGEVGVDPAARRRQPAHRSGRRASGAATFAYSVVDQLGLVSPETTVTVTVNSPPTAPQVDVVMAADSTVIVAVEATDPDGDPLVLTIVDDPTPLTIVVDGLTLTITAPLEAAHTNFTLRYTVTDPLGAIGDRVHPDRRQRSGHRRPRQPPPPTTTLAATPAAVAATAVRCRTDACGSAAADRRR